MATMTCTHCHIPATHRYAAGTRTPDNAEDVLYCAGRSHQPQHGTPYRCAPIRPPWQAHRSCLLVSICGEASDE